ncbi:MAG: class I poly(R)-hydroxyalkanoic acid synthase [Rhodobiaceae bacterium]|nr:class I poly(R)-hydroxyalkanoic acid synthase [Rhodobiaceae bacterium]MCC0013592.1 class I poly(R)-hydroxyalkanoic acid synthase [Rhodobiaceae bacterium]MCC0018294.1 class I poly(R)-hydroxyalkanoic acid synthase [Rhodobiaceae bacterium]MCC0060613.1 class I poly(R)-hydroxyalkanoic acid synthase [Rhodobiaceae bacterium]
MTVTDNAPTPYQIKDPEALARNLAALTEETGKAVAAVLGPRERGEAKMLLAAETAQAFKTLAEIVEKWSVNPAKLVEAQSGLTSKYMELWTNTLRKLSGEEVKPLASPDPGDKRFADPEWSSHPVFDFIKQAYLLTSKWADHIVEETDGLDEHTRDKARFYMKQLAAALAPSNFVFTNPELMRETLEHNGENLVNGMRMLAEDIERGHGELKLRQSDPSKFGVGVNLAMTPGKVVFQNDLMQLIQYTPTTEKVLKRPLLVVPPWINKFYILDLNPEKSFIKWAVDAGHTVFVISWVNPDTKLAKKSFADYINEGPITALDVIHEITGEKKVNAIGYCVGGTLLSITLGLMAARKDKRIATATLLTTQVDFTYAGDLKVFVDEEQVAAVEEEMKKTGYLAGSRMATAFNMLRANDLIWPYVVSNYLKGRKPFPFDLLYWNSDSTRMPAANHSFYLRNCYLDNKLSKGKMKIDDVKIDLSKSKVPIFNLATREDHIAPAKSVYFGSKSFGGPVDYVLAGSGHIAGVVNPPNKNKYQYWTGPAPWGHDETYEEWLEEAEEHPGSWWPYWQKWIETHNDKLVDAREPGGDRFKPIEDAPGSYVKVQS